MSRLLIGLVGPLKAMLRAMGLTEEHVDGTLKQVPSRLLIGLVGPMGCGKTTAALQLTQQWPGYNFRRVRFAGPLKAMLRAMGLTEEHVDGTLKQVPCELLGGKTPREAMQTLGTEWGRECIDEGLWLRAWEAQLDLSKFDYVIDDCRFPNEAKRIRELGGYIIRIERPGYEHTVTHESEAHHLTADAVVVNDGTPTLLLQRLLSVIERLEKR